MIPPACPANAYMYVGSNLTTHCWLCYTMLPEVTDKLVEISEREEVLKFRVVPDYLDHIPRKYFDEILLAAGANELGLCGPCAGSLRQGSPRPSRLLRSIEDSPC